MILPTFKSINTELMLLQSSWSRILNPILAKPQSIVLKNVELSIGSNTVNHKLDRKLQGWTIVRQRALASIYDNQDSNQQPQLTLILISDAVVSVDIEVY